MKKKRSLIEHEAGEEILKILYTPHKDLNPGSITFSILQDLLEVQIDIQLAVLRVLEETGVLKKKGIKSLLKKIKYLKKRSI